MTESLTKARLATLSPDEAAALWCVIKDQGLPVKAGLFDEWLTQSEQNATAWDAVEQAWGLFEDADDLEFAALREAALANSGRPRWPAVRAYWRPAAAAAALLVMVAGGVHLLLPPSKPADQIASGTGSSGQAFAAPADAARTFALADGTRVTLAKNARARVVFTANQRHVTLDRGSADFAVWHDASRPFEVSAMDRTIHDIGTQFAVALEDGAMRVALFEGSVRVEGGDAATVLRPGEQLVARPGRPDVVSSIPTGGETTNGLLQFDDVTLASAAETINRGSTLKLVITDPKVANLRVSGRFRAGDPERFARTVSALLSLRVVRISATGIELRRPR